MKLAVVLQNEVIDELLFKDVFTFALLPTEYVVFLFVSAYYG